MTVIVIVNKYIGIYAIIDQSISSLDLFQINSWQIYVAVFWKSLLLEGDGNKYE